MMIYDCLWINDEVTPWTFAIICWFIIKNCIWGLGVLHIFPDI